MEDTPKEMEIDPVGESAPDNSLTSILLKLRNAEDKLLEYEPNPFMELSLDGAEPLQVNEKRTRERRKKIRNEEETKYETGEKPEKAEKKKDEYTHFVSLPLHTQEFQAKALSVMETILSKFDDKIRTLFRKQNLDQIHVTLSMLTLQDDELKEKAKVAFKAKEQEISELCKHPFYLSFEKVGVFWDRGRGKHKMPRVIFLELKQDENLERLNKLCHTIISEMLNNEIIQHKDLKRMNLVCDRKTNLFSPSNYHVTLFRIRKRRNMNMGDTDFRKVFKEFEDLGFGTFPIKRIDISTRFAFDVDKFYLPLSTISLKEDEQQIEETAPSNEVTTI